MTTSGKAKKEMETKYKTKKLKAREVQQFANALELAIKASSNQSVNGKLLWWTGWQLGQTRSYTSEYSDAVKHPRIREMQIASMKSDFDESKFQDSIGLLEAANEKECEVRVRHPNPEWFDGNIPGAFAKVLSYLDIEM
jgi:hypothetical protein